ncbi:F-box protein At1g67340-like [Papaver somniferum]|uniref:F-box protein At1g67340-like n=1 Tax=Papaver somniferum TaxID=3469 RepID=UPI000E6FF8B9|nr:F-box protein At1g67340-like [Papaver somniferum]
MMKFMSSLLSRLLHAYTNSKTNSNSSEEAPINSIPREVFTEILAKVASASLVDHFNANQSCKLFHEAGSDNLIFQHASVEQLPIIQWYPKPEVATFLKQCEEAQNPEVLYRKGMVEFFHNNETELGKELLQKSANLGHVVAAYVLGIILIDAGDDEDDVLRGKQLLTQKSRCTGKRSRNGEIEECRKKAKKSIGGMWVNNSLSGAKKYSCNNIEYTARNQTDEAENQVLECETCNCNKELAYFYDMLGIMNN